MKKIVFLTGTRADFGKLKSLINVVENSDFFECYVFVTGMHTLSKYGFTYNEIKKMKYENIFIFMNQSKTSDMDTVLSNTVSGFSNFVKEIQPDLIVIHGDRLEALAGAIVGAFNNILVAHIEGGDVSGTIDDSIRHAVSKLAHLHFVSNETAKNRIIQLGEDPSHIFIIGDPAIDIMREDRLPDINAVKEEFEIPFETYSIFIFHPVTTELEHLKDQIKTVVSALIKSRKKYVIIYPNNDTGSGIIIEELEKLRGNKNFVMYPSFRFESFLSLLKNSEFIIGNSSCGIIESETLGTPAINIGTRQRNRTTSKNVINVDVDEKKILSAIDNVSRMKIRPVSNFGSGNSTELFFKVIISDDIWKMNIQKQFVDMW